jgi:hypothetical protein
MLVKGPTELAPVSLRDHGRRPFQGWQVGQILEAKVVGRGEYGTVALQIGRDQIQARSNSSLPPGETLRLRVASLGDQPVLERLHAPSPANETYAQAMRHALPRQGGLGPLLANLGAMAEAPASLAKWLPTPLLEAAREVFSMLAGASSLTDTNTLKTALINSGLFLEAKLANPQARGLEADLKAGLLRLAAQLGQKSGEGRALAEPLPPPLRGAAPSIQPPAAATLLSHLSGTEALRDLSTQVEASLARIELAQLSVLPTEDHPYPAWLIDLPVREGAETRVFQFQIEEEPSRGEGKAQRPWSVMVAFELEGLGPIYARLTFLDNAVSAHLWAEWPETHRLFESHLEELRKGLAGEKLETVHVQCFQGKPTGSAPPSGHQDLVDVTV